MLDSTKGRARDFVVAMAIAKVIVRLRGEGSVWNSKGYADAHQVEVV